MLQISLFVSFDASLIGVYTRIPFQGKSKLYVVIFKLKSKNVFQVISFYTSQESLLEIIRSI